ncbi:putative flavin monooxygenase, FAD/NAD(P)-binding domain superfamily [Helianthus annuus]|nr:putative flavin monooxygenase, FAD/NAD(P)-binding domain superfamily [Helianthus annuus]KAJ0928542.1 putative flavin monooxygenase, FAD/NAD(P)-binding domain superfamily [Helianthus annuus]
MSFTDFKFSEKVYGDPRMYPGHKEVLKFLTDFATHFELTELSRFNTLVTRVEVVESDITEFVESNMNGVISVEVFDAVVVDGHNAQPRLETNIPAKNIEPFLFQDISIIKTYIFNLKYMYIFERY